MDRRPTWPATTRAGRLDLDRTAGRAGAALLNVGLAIRDSKLGLSVDGHLSILLTTSTRSLPHSDKRLYAVGAGSDLCHVSAVVLDPWAAPGIHWRGCRRSEWRDAVQVRVRFGVI